METFKQKIDLSTLSEEARRELVDFYQFLIGKYGRVKVRKMKRFQNLIDRPLRVKSIIIPLREQLYER